ncbi:MAG: DUF1553 domain-containing protein, partial [Gemmataceae bacterium]|nr:DUF1553 domain-containing protein [Gemmataceae bacterium]
NEQVKATAKASPTAAKDLEGSYPEEIKKELKSLRDELARLEKSAPSFPSAMGVTEGISADVAVHVRGNHLKLGKVVARGVPRVLAGKDAPAFDVRRSGRLPLARWLARRDHPLTSRVLVNRLWRWHFGQGLVRSVDNFGALGEPPSHPELLDWLAHRFVDSGWSLKALHRLILLSNTYQMSSAHDDRAAERDPENRLLWRANLRRLEAEAIRDALLAVSGTLDLTRGGSLLHVKNRDYFFDHTSKDMTKYDSRRRSLYLPVVRNHLYDVFQLFDSTDATVLSGDRATTTVAPQALFLLNSDLVMQVSESLAAKLLAMTCADTHRLQRLYVNAYGRPATTAETVRAQVLLEDVERELRPKEPNAARRQLQAWACLCQVVLAANEFVYIR